MAKHQEEGFVWELWERKLVPRSSRPHQILCAFSLPGPLALGVRGRAQGRGNPLFL